MRIKQCHIKLNENQLIAIHLIASGVKASVIANQLKIRKETLNIITLETN